MKRLAEILEAIEKSEGVRLDDFPLRYPYGGNDVFTILDFIDSSGTKSWHRIGQATGEIEQGFVDHLPPECHFGWVIYFVSADLRSALFYLPTGDAGIQFSKDETQRLNWDRRAEEMKASFESGINFEKLGCKNEYLRFLEDWLALGIGDR